MRPSGNINDRQGQLADFSDKLKEFYLSLDDFCEGIWFYADIIKPFIDGRILYRDVHGLFEKVPCILRELVRLLGTGERPHLRVFVSHEMELDTIRKDRPINSSNISLLCVADEHLAKWRHPGSEFGGLMRQISAAYDSPFLDEKVGSPLRSISERPRRGRPPAVAPEKIVDEMRANPDASDGEIGKKLGVSRQTVRRVLDAYNGDDTEL